MRTRLMLVCGLLVTMLATASGFAASYTADFNSDEQGFRYRSTNPNWNSGPGYNGASGFIRAENDPPDGAFQGTTILGGTPTNPNFANDLGAQWGPAINLSYWVKDLDGTEGTRQPDYTFRLAGGSPVNTIWRFHSGVTSAPDWTQISTIFHSDWTDAEAIGAGWVREGGTQSFAAVVAAVDTWIFQTRGPVGGVDSTGLDHVFIGTPEPTTIALLGLGGLLMLKRQRKSA